MTGGDWAKSRRQIRREERAGLEKTEVAVRYSCRTLNEIRGEDYIPTTKPKPWINIAAIAASLALFVTWSTCLYLIKTAI